MKNYYFILSFLFISANSLRAQTHTLNWSSSFSPVWGNGNTSGSASAVGGTGVNVSINITKTGGVFNHSEANAAIASPTVTGTSFTVAGSSSNLELAMDFNNHGEHAEITYTFSTAVTNIQFDISDIDKPSANSNAYLDEVVISGSNGNLSYVPTITKYDSVTDPSFLIISGNTVSVNHNDGTAGNSASTSTDQKGTIAADFGANLITAVTIRYKNNSNAQSNPSAQSIAIGNLSFQVPVILPLGFTYVKTKTLPHQTIVQWQIASENNNGRFEIEKSFNRQSWSKIGTVAMNSATSGLTNYSFTDSVIEHGIVHYRVKLVDGNGRMTYSDIVSATRTHKHFMADIYPNPVDASSVITAYAYQSEEIIVSLIDVSGRNLFSDDWLLSKGTNELSISQLGKLKKGHYVLRLYNPATHYSRTIKLLKL